jgi:AcrR family transcriptional regulator
MDDPRNLSPRAREIVLVAGELLDEEGLDGLTMRKLAERLGIRAPSIYKHLADKEALEHALISDGFEQVASRFRAALERGPTDPVRSLAHAYRGFAQERPHLYRLMTQRELDRARLAPGVEDAAAQPLLDALGGDGDLARAMFAFVHGMTILELDRRFPAGADLDQAWERGLRAIIAAAPNTRPRATRRRV